MQVSPKRPLALIVLNEMLLVLEIGGADRVRVPPKAEYEYEKPSFLACHRIEGSVDQRALLRKETALN